MKNRIWGLLALIFLVMAIGACFIPFLFEYKIYNGLTKSYYMTDMINIVKTYVACPSEYIHFRIGFYIASGIGLVFTVLQLILAKARWLKIPAMAAVLAAAFFMGLCGHSLLDYMHYENYVGAWYSIEAGFYVVMVLLTITVILLTLGLLIRPKRTAVEAEGTVTAPTGPSGFPAEPQGQPFYPSAPPAPSAEDTSGITKQLMEYKQLLDTGVITQEEFDAKKKQILGL